MAKKKGKASATAGGVAGIWALVIVKSLSSVGKLVGHIDLDNDTQTLWLAIGGGAVIFLLGLVFLLRHKIRPRRLRDQTSVAIVPQTGYVAASGTRMMGRSKLWLAGVFWGLAAVIAVGYAVWLW